MCDSEQSRFHAGAMLNTETKEAWYTVPRGHSISGSTASEAVGVERGAPGVKSVTNDMRLE